MSRESSISGHVQGGTVAYVVSRFPAVTETFIMDEILALERLGARVEIFALVHRREPLVHREAERLVQRAHYASVFSMATLRAQLWWLRRRPAAYLSAWRDALVGNARSWRFLLRALVVVPLAARFARQMLEAGVAHVHAHWATHPALAAYVVSRLTDLPSSFTAHAHDLYVDRSMLDRKIAAASAVVTISEHNERLIRDTFGADAAAKTTVIRCGIDVDRFTNIAKAATDPRRPFTVLCVAGLRDYKGHRYLVNACDILRREGVDFRCLLVGEGPERPAIEALIAEHGLQAWVTLLGSRPRDEVLSLLGQADAVVLPSVTTPRGKKEGIPVALMEALAAGVPAVASDISGIPELIEDRVTGLLVPERDAHALARAIGRLARDPNLAQRLSLQGRERVRRLHDIDKNADELLRLLTSQARRGQAALSGEVAA
jgi:colanic acid/amylovoran biosynthesis glycosyltransferase